MTTTFCVVSPGTPADGATLATWQAKMQNASTRGVDLVTALLPWSFAQASAGASIAAAITQLTTYLNTAATYGLQAVLEVGLHLPPAFVLSGVEQFKKQDTAVWAGTAGAGDQVRNWQWTAQGRTYVADLFAKLGGSGIATHPALAGIRLGGGAFGSAQYAPVTTSPLQWWIFGTALQTGTGLAADQVVCPLPGRTPLFNGSNDAGDHAIANWWLNGMSTWVKWLIAQAEGAGFGARSQRIWVMHPPSTGVRDRPHTDTAWINEVARGIAPRRLMGAYRSDMRVFPWAMQNDPGTGTTETTMGSAAHLLEHARVFEMLGSFADETAATTTNLDTVYPVHNGLSVDSLHGAAAQVFSVADDTSLTAAVTGTHTWRQYQSLIATGVAGPAGTTPTVDGLFDASDPIFNLIGSKTLNTYAQLQTINGGAARQWWVETGSGSNAAHIWKGVSTDPLWDVIVPAHRGRLAQTIQLHVPAGVVQPTGADFALSLIADVVVGGVAHPACYDLWQATVNRTATPRPQITCHAWAAVWMDDTAGQTCPGGNYWIAGQTTGDSPVVVGTQDFSSGKTGGARAPNVPWVAGSITAADVDRVLNQGAQDFGHVLAIATRSEVRANTNAAPCTAWETSGPPTGAIPNGGRIVFAPNVPIPAAATPVVKAAIRTLRDFGGDLVDGTGGAQIFLYSDQGQNPTPDTEMRKMFEFWNYSNTLNDQQAFVKWTSVWP